MATKRATQPAAEEIESLPFLGRSWYRRGISYWLRRAVATFMMLVVLTILTLITGGLIDAIATDASVPVWGRSIILVVIAAAIVRSVVKAWSAFNVANRQARKRGVAMTMAEASGEPRRNARERQRRAVRGGAGLGAIAMLGAVHCS